MRSRRFGAGRRASSLVATISLFSSFTELERLRAFLLFRLLLLAVPA